ncbi:Mitogen-activated protein kinase kinase kinase A [Diplonema papillatum]|nr:Mitogen-activated protein kinase kinase kinase A [Diplonema papillatum]
MEYMPGGSLGALVRKLGVNLKESTAVLYMRQILNGVAFMHSRGVLHRDIKGDNILLAADGTVKLGDLGACGSLQARMSLGANVGTPLWMAPEVISRAQSFSTASDVWALGIVAVEVLNQGRPPWPAYETSYQALYAISKWARPLPPDVPGHLGESCLSFLRHCHDPVPASRLSASELLRHAWLDPPAHAPRVPDDETGLAAIVESDRDLRFLYDKNRAAVCCCTAEEPSTEELSTEYADAFGGSEAFSAVLLSLRRGSSTMANSAGASDSTSLPLLPR